MSSSRFPGKVMTKVNDLPVIAWQVKRLMKARNIHRLVVATSNDKSDDVLANYLKSINVSVYRGSLNDVLSRFVQVAELSPEEFLVRLTADCPLIMPEICDEVIEKFLSGRFDYVSNTIVPTFPDGCDVEIFTKKVLQQISHLPTTTEEREHVTMKIYRNRDLFRIGNLKNTTDDSSHRWTLDYPEDLQFVRKVYNLFKGKESEFTYTDVMEAMKKGLIPPHLDIKRLRNIALTGEK